MTLKTSSIYGIRLKQQILKEIRDARIAHEKWVRRAKHLVENLPVDEKMIPLDSTECHFGQWIYNHGMRYKSIPALNVIIHKIEKEHRDLHDIYLRIYKIYFLETQRSWAISLIISSRKEVSTRKQEEGLYYYKMIEKTSASLIQALEEFEACLILQRDEVLATLS